MKTQHKKLFTKAAVWLVAEVVLNIAGMDTLADYSEFIFDYDPTAAIGHPTITTTLVFDRSDISSLFT